MNERIRELVEQCTSWSDGSTWTSREVFDKKKFAELLIRECAAYVKNSNCFTYASQADLCAERMTQHFGVEQ
jgi:hypothetical protein